MRINTRNKLLIPIVTILIILGFTVYKFMTSMMLEQFQAEQESSFKAKIVELKFSSDRIAKAALSHAELYSRQPEVIAAYKLALKGDIDDPMDRNVALARNKLREFVNPILKGIKENTPDTKYKLHFHLPNGRSLVRIWRKTQQLDGRDLSDDISSFRQTVLDINQGNHQAIKGIELGRGGFAIRGLAAISDENGQHLGSVEMLYSFNDVIKFAKSSKKQNFAIYMNKDKLDITTSLQDKNKHPLLGNKFVFVTSTDADKAKTLISDKLILAGSRGVSNLVLSGSYYIQAFPINDYKGQQIGVMAMYFDASQSLASIAAMQNTILLVSVLLVLIILGVIIVVTNHIVKPVQIMSGIAMELANGNIDHNYTLERNDEIGDLANAFNKMTDYLQQKAHEANNIADENFDEKIEVASDMDLLGKSMIRMRDNLVSSKAKTEEALSDAQLKVDILNKLPNPTFVVNREMTVQYINPAGAKAANTPIDQIIGKKCYQLFKNPQCQTDQCATNCAMRTAKYVENETVIDATQQPIRYIGAPLTNKQGEVIGGIEQIFDITTIKNIINEVNSTTAILTQGNLSARVNVDDATGDYLALIQGVNRVIDNLIKPTEEAISCLSNMAKGDMTHYMEGDYKGDYKKLQTALNKSLDSVNNILTGVTDASAQVESGSRQVSDSSQALSQGATQQASSLQEITASLTEFGTRTERNADNADRANKISDQAREDALKGNNQMMAMLDAMNNINESSGKIGKIIKTIEDIAFQTNLLALNAAVEAARAGVHGKGFAVVAEEVRNLAQRSAKAVQETTTIIEESIEKAKNGTHIAQETEKSLKQIDEKVTMVSDLLEEIAHASKEQSSGVKQTTEGLRQIDAVTQSNTASAEETAAASEELSSQAATLKSMLAEFTIKHGILQDSVSGNPDINRPAAPFADEKEVRETTEIHAEEEVHISLDDDEFGSF